jgi:hypothetical protein
MAVKRQKNWISQQRVDNVHLREIESAVAGDFDDLAGKIMASGKPLVVSGMALSMGAAVGSFATQLVLNTAGSIVLHGTASEPGALFVVPGTQPAETLNTSNTNILGAFTPNAINYIGIDLIRLVDNTTTDLVKFRSATTKKEFSQQVPLARTLRYRIVISTNDFVLQPNVAPIAEVILDTNGVVTSVTDCRQMMFRLGTGGSSPNPLAPYSWVSRTENPVTSTSTVDPFVGADKSIASFLDFFHALESRLWEVGGGEHWYSQTSDRDVLFIRDSANIFTDGENFEWTGSNIHWKGISFDFGNSTAVRNTINQQLTNSAGLTDLAVGECLYVDVDRATDGAALTMHKAALTSVGGGAIPGSRQIIAWRVTEGVFVRGQMLPVGSSNVHATTSSYGVVELYFGTGLVALDAVVPYIRATTTDMLVPTITSVAQATNAWGVKATGNGTSPGVWGIGGATNGGGVYGQGTAAGSGVRGDGGSTNAPGVEGRGGGTTGTGVTGTGGVGSPSGAAIGVWGVGKNTGAGVHGDGGGTGIGTGGPGIVGVGGPNNGNGVEGTGDGLGSGIVGNGGPVNGAGVLGNGGTGTGSGGPGILGIGGTPDGTGVEGTGYGIGSGIVGTGGDTAGTGVRGDGGGTGAGPGGPGLVGVGGANDGNGVEGTGDGIGSGVVATGGPTAGSYGVQASGGVGGGCGVRGNGTGTVVGVYGINSNAAAAGMSGVGGAYGVLGSLVAAGVLGVGVYGDANAATTDGTGVKGRGKGAGYGLHGILTSTGSVAIYGDASAGATNSRGVVGQGKGNAPGVEGIGVGGSNAASTIGEGGRFIGGTGAPGLTAYGNAGGAGIVATGGPTNGSIGVVANSAATNGDGLHASGTGTGTGILALSGAGNPISVQGNTTGGHIHMDVVASVSQNTGANCVLWFDGTNLRLRIGTTDYTITKTP